MSTDNICIARVLQIHNLFFSFVFLTSIRADMTTAGIFFNQNLVMSPLIYIYRPPPGLHVMLCRVRGSEKHCVFWKCKIHSPLQRTRGRMHWRPAVASLPVQALTRHSCAVNSKYNVRGSGTRGVGDTPNLGPNFPYIFC